VALVVNFNPADPVALGAFWAAYGFTNTSAQVFGPYSGKLGNRSDRIAIEKPQYPDVVGDPYSWVVLDEVIYGNQDPRPVIANGQGRSLARRSNPGSGLDPANWTAAEPTPGAVQSAVVDRDGDGMPDSWEGQHGLNSDDPADAALDSDLDGKTNLEEFLSGTDPRDPASVLQFSSVVDQGNSTRLSFTAVAGKSYTVQFRPFVDSGSWQRVKDVPADPATRQVTVDDDMNPGQTARFYRLITPALP
jgi:hypothetical protein